jgi:hypothetical protein
MRSRTASRPRITPQRITPMRFDMAAATLLDGLVIERFLNGLRLETDGDGFIKPAVVRALKDMLAAAEVNAPNDIVAQKFHKMSAFMADYT